MKKLRSFLTIILLLLVSAYMVAALIDFLPWSQDEDELDCHARFSIANTLLELMDCQREQLRETEKLLEDIKTIQEKRNES